MCKCYIHANLVKIRQLVHDIVHTSTFWLKFGSLCPAVILKIRSRSPKPNQLFIMSQCYILANLVTIHLLVHEISCIQESVTLTPTGSAPKTICPIPLRWGTKIYDCACMLKIIVTLSTVWDRHNLYCGNCFVTKQLLQHPIQTNVYFFRFGFKLLSKRVSLTSLSLTDYNI